MIIPQRTLPLFIGALCAIFFSAPALAQEKKSIQTVLVSEQEAMIASPISGRISTLSLHDGDLFKKGDVLAAFDCTIEKAQLEKTQAQLSMAAARLKAQQKLQELKAGSKIDFLIARAESRRARAEVSEYKSRLNFCTIKAPFAGRITGRNANPFESIEAGKPLLKISSLKNLQAQLLVPSNWLNDIKIGSALHLKIHENGKSYPAHIIRIGGAVDAVSQSIMMVAQLDETQEELLPGMSGTALFEDAEETPEKLEASEENTDFEPANPAPTLEIAPHQTLLQESE